MHIQLDFVNSNNGYSYLRNRLTFVLNMLTTDANIMHTHVSLDGAFPHFLSLSAIVKPHLVCGTNYTKVLALVLCGKKSEVMIC